ncbi:class I SAM-dependent methyltransferase [Streptomyces sp. CA2R106]|uniref:class I SAM-dependent methyltransferase n=1 Tax=Streptomyces sp. CA2R106 TaxID=3120153 RepID=UPI003008D9E1
MADRALSFGAGAEAYERFRPGYPAALADTVTAYAGHPPRTVLEIGAGTGKATRLFAARGTAVTATEPDPAMLAELRRRVPAEVRTVPAAFEQLSPQSLRSEDGAGPPPYDLVYAAASLHWTAPDGRWPRVAALLRPGGVFACFGGPVQLADPAVAEAVRAARAPFMDRDDIPSPDGTPPDHPMQWPGTELQRSDRFADVQHTVIQRKLTMTADDYLGHLGTISAYLMLPAAERRHALRAIAAVLPATVVLTADLHIHLARRRP